MRRFRRTQKKNRCNLKSTRKYKFIHPFIYLKPKENYEIIDQKVDN